MTAVVKIGTSSITSADGELDDRALAKLADEVAERRRRGPPGRARSVGRDRRRAARRSGLDRRPTDIGTLQAIAAVGQPRLMARVARPARRATTSSAGQVLLTPYDFVHRSPVPARPPDARPPPRPRRRARSSTRTTPSPTTRSATATTTGSPRSCPTSSAPTSSSCSPTPPGSSPPTPASTTEASPDRGDRRGRRRARGRRRRRRHRPGQRRDGQQARRGEDRRLVRRAGRHRRRPTSPASSPTPSTGRPGRHRRRAPRRSGCRAASCGSRSPAAPPGAIVVDAGARARPRRGPPLAAPRRGPRRRRAPSTPTTPSRSSTDDGAVFAKGLVRYDSDDPAPRSPGRRTDRPARRRPPRGHPPRRPRRARLTNNSPRVPLRPGRDVGHTSPTRRRPTGGGPPHNGGSTRPTRAASVARGPRRRTNRNGAASRPSRSRASRPNRPRGRRGPPVHSGRDPPVAELGRRAKAASRRLATAAARDAKAAAHRRRRPPPRAGPRDPRRQRRRPRRRRGRRARRHAPRPAPTQRRPPRRHGRRRSAGRRRWPTPSARCSTGGAAPTASSCAGSGCRSGSSRSSTRTVPTSPATPRAICVKSGNAALLRGLGERAALQPGHRRRRLRDALAKAGLPADAVHARRRHRARGGGRRSCSLTDYVDCLIPRGGPCPDRQRPRARHRPRDHRR